MSGEVCNTFAAIDNYNNPLLARYKFDISSNQTEDKFLDSLDDNFTQMLLKRGNLFSTTGLRNLGYSDSSIKHFNCKLTDDLNSQDTENLNQMSYSTNIRLIKSFDEDIKSIKITVSRASYKDGQESKVTSYVGVFFSWRSNENEIQDYLPLPFLFSVGSQQQFTASMHALFEKYFGCKIAPILFPQHEFKWLLTLIIQQVENVTEDIQLVYQTNSDSLKMDFTFSTGFIKEIWNEIHDKNRSKITYEEVVRLQAALEEHILETYGIDLSYFHLKRFTLFDRVSIEALGKMHIKDIETLDLVLRFLKIRLDMQMS